MWEENAPNLTSNGSPHFTLVPSSGTEIGADYGTKNVWPYSTKTSWTGVSGKPLKNIKESNGVITLTYIEEPVIPVDPFDVVFMANGEGFETISSTGKLILPTSQPEACTDGKVFVGWTATADYKSETTAPAFAAAGDAVEEGAVFYAVFATKDGDVKPAVVDKLTLATTGVSSFSYTAWSNVKVSSDAVYAGNTAGGNDAIQLRSKNSTSGIITTASGGKVSKVVVAWNGNTSSGRTLDIYGKNIAYSAISDLYDSNNKGTKLGSIAYGSSTTLNISGDYTYIGLRSNDGALYLDAINVTWGEGGNPYSNYTTICGGDETDVENTATPVTAVKTLRNGQLVIIRGNAVYSASGVRIQ